MPLDGAHFYDLMDYNGVTFLVDLQEWNSTGNFWVEKILVSRDLKIVQKMVPVVVLIFNSRLALNSVLEITT